MLDTTQNNQPSKLNPEDHASEFLAKIAQNLAYTDLKKRPLIKSLGSQTIGTSPVTIAHGINATPNIVIVQMTSAGTIWQSTAADKTNIHLNADAVGRTCNVTVIYFPNNIR